DAQVVGIGGGMFQVYGEAPYSSPGTYSVEVAVADVGGSTITLTNTATVVDVAPPATTLPIVAVEGTAFSGAVARFEDPDPTGTATNFTATITWGDGATSTGAISTGATGEFYVSGTHTYSAAGSPVFSVTIVNDTGLSSVVSDTAVIEDAQL